MFFRVIVALPLVCAGAAIAEEPAGAAAPRIEPPWDAILVPWSEPRYKVEAVRFKARDETGIDWLGSDEVAVETADAKGFTDSNEIGGIDSGDTHEFDPNVSCIIGVRPGLVTLGEDSVCDRAGEPGPFSFTVELWEKDEAPFSFGACIPAPPGPGHHNGAVCANDGLGDDFIGRRELFFPAPELAATLPNVGDSFTETVVLSPCGEGVDTCGGWDLPDYSFTYRTTRLPDVPTDFRSRLLAAMERSGVLTAGATVAAGLQSLATPADRQAVEEQTSSTLAEE
ncbi:MAG: hypothetical protein U1E59_06015 [Amaricoccus sp.]